MIEFLFDQKVCRQNSLITQESNREKWRMIIMRLLWNITYNFLFHFSFLSGQYHDFSFTNIDEYSKDHSIRFISDCISNNFSRTRIEAIKWMFSYHWRSTRKINLFFYYLLINCPRFCIANRRKKNNVTDLSCFFWLKIICHINYKTIRSFRRSRLWGRSYCSSVTTLSYSNLNMSNDGKVRAC